MIQVGISCPTNDPDDQGRIPAASRLADFHAAAFPSIVCRCDAGKQGRPAANVRPFLRRRPPRRDHGDAEARHCSGDRQGGGGGLPQIGVPLRKYSMANQNAPSAFFAS